MSALLETVEVEPLARAEASIVWLRRTHASTVGKVGASRGTPRDLSFC